MIFTWPDSIIKNLFPMEFSGKMISPFLISTSSKQSTKLRMFLIVSGSKISIEPSKSSLFRKASSGLEFAGISTRVCSTLAFAIFRPRSFLTSFFATWRRNKFYFALAEKFENASWGVWIGGTPASWRIRSYLSKFTFASYWYLSCCKNPHS